MLYHRKWSKLVDARANSSCGQGSEASGFEASWGSFASTCVFWRKDTHQKYQCPRGFCQPPKNEKRKSWQQNIWGIGCFFYLVGFWNIWNRSSKEHQTTMFLPVFFSATKPNLQTQSLNNTISKKWAHKKSTNNIYIKYYQVNSTWYTSYIQTSTKKTTTSKATNNNKTTNNSLKVIPKTIPNKITTNITIPKTSPNKNNASKCFKHHQAKSTSRRSSLPCSRTHQGTAPALALAAATAAAWRVTSRVSTETKRCLGLALDVLWLFFVFLLICFLVFLFIDVCCFGPLMDILWGWLSMSENNVDFLFGHVLYS